MSANTSITEGGKARPFGPVKVLMVQGEDGKYYPWFPESDRALATLSVDKNGIYRASDKGVYEWSSVSVNVPQNEGVTGKAPDTGNEVYVHPDPETGELVTDVLPVEIRITTPPTQTSYTDGEAINLVGAVIKAYSATGKELQTVPLNEIHIDPTTADISKAGTKITSELIPVPFEYANAGDAIITVGENQFIYKYKMPNGRITMYPVNTNGYAVVGGSDSSTAVIEVEVLKNLVVIQRYNISSNDSLTYNELKAYKSGATMKWGIPNVNVDINGPICNNEAMAYEARFKAWTLTYGTPKTEQPITVFWPRPGDGAVLETTFTITVTGGD